MYRTQIKMQLQKQHDEMLARKEEERKRGENQQIPQQSGIVLMFQLQSKSVGNSDVSNDVLKALCVCACVHACMRTCVCVHALCVHCDLIIM